MTKTVKLTKQGRITIPKKMRENFCGVKEFFLMYSENKITLYPKLEDYMKNGSRILEKRSTFLEQLEEVRKGEN